MAATVAVSTIEQRLAALEARMAALEGGTPLKPRNANARWLNAVKFTNTCATPRCRKPIPQGACGYYVPKGNPDAGLYCESCGEVMSPRSTP